MPANQQPGDRYVQQPDGHGETGEELYCPLDPDRVCSAECVAFDIQGVRAEGRTTCIVVNAMKQGASALAVLAKRLTPEAQQTAGADVPPPKVNT